MRKIWIPLLCLLIIAGTAILAMPGSSVARLPGNKNSVVLIVVDALNPRHIGSLGSAPSHTPNIDQLAAAGHRYTDWISNAPWTRPSFTTILTGLPKCMHRMEMEGNSLAGGITTLGELFRQNGYATAAFIGNPVIQKTWGYHQGFDVFEDASVHGAFPKADVLIDRAITWLKKQSTGSRPSFTVIFLTDPHAPWESTDSPTGFLDPPREVSAPLDDATRDAMISAYDQAIQRADTQIGTLIAFLKTSETGKHNAIALTADHGEMLGAHNCWHHATHMWEDALKVPFILVAPGRTAPGTADSRPFTHEDVMPTLADVAGVTLPKNLSGFSALGDVPENRIRVSQYDARGLLRRAVRMHQWKLIYHAPLNREAYLKLDGAARRDGLPPSLLKPTPRYELYNLDEDPLERADVFLEKKNDETIRLLMKKAHPADPSAKKSKKPAGSIPTPALSPELEEALRAGGYIQ